MMILSEFLEPLLAGQSLSEENAGKAISAVMDGLCTPAQTAALLTVLRIKGETVEEIVGAARAMRAHAIPITTRHVGAIDTCGTGGDRSGSFNISTTSAFVTAAAGIPVAKHGNRSATSQCGSIDLLEQLGINVMMDAEKAGACLDETGMTVLFARVFHPAMKHAAPIRTELAFRTIFNYLGPLTNPVHPEYQLVGISDGDKVDIYARCLQKLGLKRAWVVHASDGLDEITLTGPTLCLEVTPEKITSLKILPEEIGLPLCQPGDLKGGTLEENAAITRAILSREEQGPKRDIVLLNAGAALFLAGKAQSLPGGIELARRTIDSGKSMELLRRLVEFSNHV